MQLLDERIEATREQAHLVLADYRQVPREVAVTHGDFVHRSRETNLVRSGQLQRIVNAADVGRVVLLEYGDQVLQAWSNDPMASGRLLSVMRWTSGL